MANSILYRSLLLKRSELHRAALPVDWEIAKLTERSAQYRSSLCDCIDCKMGDTSQLGDGHAFRNGRWRGNEVTDWQELAAKIEKAGLLSEAAFTLAQTRPSTAPNHDFFLEFDYYLPKALPISAKCATVDTLINVMRDVRQYVADMGAALVGASGESFTGTDLLVGAAGGSRTLAVACRQFFGNVWFTVQVLQRFLEIKVPGVGIPRHFVAQFVATVWCQLLDANQNGYKLLQVLSDNDIGQVLATLGHLTCLNWSYPGGYYNLRLWVREERCKARNIARLTMHDCPRLIRACIQIEGPQQVVPVHDMSPFAVSGVDETGDEESRTLVCSVPQLYFEVRCVFCKVMPTRKDQFCSPV